MNFKKSSYIFLIVVIFILAIFIRLNNVWHYNTYWADDGGAHLAYVDHIIQEKTLPSFSENYLAWHEPLYYFLSAYLINGVHAISNISFKTSDFLELLNSVIYLFTLFLIYKLTYKISNNRVVSIITLFLFSFIFIGVKLSAYANNELLCQFFILLLVYLFLKHKFLDENKKRGVFFWAILLAIAILTKLTAILVLVSACIIWGIKAVKARKLYPIYYILISIVVVGALNTPWLIYKQQHFEKVFSINIYEDQNAQNIFKSDAWRYITKFNSNVFSDNAYWSPSVDSYLSIFISDTFVDHYNLFNNPDKNKAISDNFKFIIPPDSRYVTVESFTSMLIANRFGLIVFCVWVLGIFIYIIDVIVRKKIDLYILFILILLFGGWCALLYNNIRFPYLARGVLKGGFIFFTYPLFVALSYAAIWKLFKNHFVSFAVIVLPTLFYFYFVWPIIFIK